MRFKLLVVPCLCLILNQNVFAEPLTTDVFESNMLSMRVNTNSTRVMCTPTMRCGSVFTGQFYKTYNFQNVWVINGKLNPEASSFLDILTNSYLDGLNPNDYHVKEINDLINQINELNKSGKLVPSAKLLDLELMLSDAYLLYLKHIEVGRIDTMIYPTWQIDRKRVNLVEQYLTAVRNNQLINTLYNAVPKTQPYKTLKQQLGVYQKIAENGGWESIPLRTVLKIGSHGESVKLLHKRLSVIDYYKIGAGNSSDNFDLDTKNAVIAYQKDNGLVPNGVVDKITLQSLNIPVTTRIKQIQINLDRLRWLPISLGNQYIWVNIPSYSLEIFKSGYKELAMPVIVGGGGENKTCVVSSTVTTLELNPYWGIPNRIATKEYLHKIQQDPDYLAKHNIRVFSNSTKEEIDPSSISWESINPNQFNYFLRQDPGKQNALGKIKFLFANNCGIYLHDTSNPNLFSRNARSLSHGCVRVGQPMVLANYLINGNPNWSTDRVNKVIKSGDHTWVKLTNQLPIYIVYQTVVVNNNSHLEFKKDIYNADNVNFLVYIPTTNNLSYNVVSK